MDEQRMKNAHAGIPRRVSTILAAGVFAAVCTGEDFREAPPELQEASTAIVRMTDEMRFEPDHAVVSVGDTVVWMNAGELPHTSTDEPERAVVPEHAVLPPGAEPWDSGGVSPGARFRKVFDVPGEYTYFCVLHEAVGMVGLLTVVPR